MALANLKPSSRAVTGLIIITVCLFFGCVLVYMVAASKIKAVDAKLAEKQKQVKDAKIMVKKLDESRLNYLDSQSQLRFLESSVTTQAYVPTMLKQIENLGKSNNLRVISVRPAPAAAQAPVRKLSSGAQAAEGNMDKAAQSSASGEKTASKPVENPYDELKVDIELEGKYMSALDFLYKLTAFPKIIAVNTVQMSPAASREVIGSPYLRIKLNVTAFVLKDGNKNVQPETAAVGGNTAGERSSGNGAG